MSSYILRRLDPVMWAAFKARAAREGHPLNWVILRLIQHYLTHGLAQQTPERQPVMTFDQSERWKP